MLDNVKAEVAQANQNMVFIQCGSNSHFPFLAARPPVKEKIAEVGQSQCQRSNTNQWHDKKEYLKIRAFRKFPRGLEKSKRQNNVDCFAKVLQRFPNPLCDGIIQPTAARDGEKEAIKAVRNSFSNSNVSRREARNMRCLDLCTN
jgi:hypothetical protein